MSTDSWHNINLSRVTRYWYNGLHVSIYDGENGTPPGERVTMEITEN